MQNNSDVFVRCVFPADTSPIFDPTWKQVEDAIQLMTGEEEDNSVVLLSAPNTEPWLAIHGETGRYIIEYFDQYSYILVSPSNMEADAEVEISAFGMIDFFSTEMIVDIKLTLQVANNFYITGRKVDSLQWKLGGV